MSNAIAIKVENVSKIFKLPKQKHTSIKSSLIHFSGGRRGFEEQRALNNVSFEVKKGEFFGIVGRNGSGKSTMLKILAGIYVPSKGRVEINGKLTPFIELGVGFNPELTGRENVFLNGALLGFNRKEMDAMYEDIVDFAELEKFMDQKLKNYSSGMQVRLAFSIAIRANTEILVLDEVLAVGDINFQRKCFEYFASVKNRKQTVILVTHDMGIASRYCDRALLLDSGDKIVMGNSAQVIDAYMQISKQSASDTINKENIKIAQTRENNADSSFAAVESVWTETKTGNITSSFKSGEYIHVLMKLKAHETIESLRIILTCNNPGGPPVIYTRSDEKKLALKLKKSETLDLIWKIPGIYNDGIYELSVSLEDRNNVYKPVRNLDILKFEIRGWEYPNSITHPNDSLEIVSLTQHPKGRRRD